ncbi:MAG: 50S ribosomal protein L25/general stress protein Ctc [Bacteroidales bacterium]|nr:50S ribosomal protein L25/general stress protein Ctc [Bacteroidales bacterium]
MKIFELNGNVRTDLSKAAVKSLRKNGLVPCVLYGNNVENIHFSVSIRDIKGLIYTPSSYIVTITIDGKAHLAILHDAQFHPVTDEVLHLDFLTADESRPITIPIPVVIEGVSEGVKAGGKLIISSRKLSVKGLMKDLPDTLPINISDLKLGKQIVAGDLKYPNIQIVNRKDTIICAVKMTRAALGAAAAAAAAEKK